MDVTVSVGVGDDYREVAVADLAELDALLDRIAAESDPDQPTAAPVTRGDGVMAISEGPAWATVHYHHVLLDGHSPQHASLGDRDAKGVVVVSFAGEWTELMRWSCIDKGLAREAMRHFYRTGGLWPGVSWVPDELEDDLYRANA